MNRFIKQILFFALPLLLAGIIAEMLLRNIPNDYVFKRKYLDKNADSLNVLVLGNSHAFYGINPDYFSRLNTFNSSHISQPLKFDYEILKKYSGRFNQLKFIVLPVTYVSLYGSIENEDDEWRIKNYIIYYKLDIPAKFNYHSEVLSNKLMINIERLYSYYIKKKSNITCSNSGWGLYYDSKSKRNLVLTGKAAAKRHSANGNKYFNENAEMLKKILDLAQSKHVKIILLTTPAFHSYTDHLNKIKLNNMIAELTNLDNEYENVTYLNFLTDSSFKEKDFFDADHLNEIGARKFTVKIDSTMTEIKSGKISSE